MFVISPFLVPLTSIVCVFIFIIVRTLVRARVRELEIRERIAMIERGLVPAPEVDPRGFDNVMQRLERHDRRYGTGRHRRAGVTLIGVGVGLMVLIGFAGGEPNSAIGVGGFLVVIGIAFFINGLLDPPERAGSEAPNPSWTAANPPAKPSDTP